MERAVMIEGALSGGFDARLSEVVERVHHVAAERVQFAIRTFVLLRYGQNSEGRQDLGGMYVTRCVRRHVVNPPAAKVNVSQNIIPGACYLLADLDTGFAGT